MKKIFKKMTVSLMSALMLCSSTYMVSGSASAANNDIEPRGTYHVYGDVNEDGSVNIADAACIMQFIGSYKNENGNNPISLANAVKYNGKYALTVPQAADIDGDGFITEADHICIQYYVAGSHDKAGRCGQLFYIN